MAIVIQVVCSLFIILSLVFFLGKNKRSDTGASKGQMILAGWQIILCGWFFALCFSDVLDIRVNFSYVRFILNIFYFIAFLSISLYTLFAKYRKNDRDLKCVIISYIVLIGVQCFVFPYETENEFWRIFEAAEGAVVYGLLIAVLIKLYEGSFCKKALLAAAVLEFVVAVENVIMPFAQITDDFQAVDIPLNFTALFMRPVLLASLALVYRAWLDRRGEKTSHSR